MKKSCYTKILDALKRLKKDHPTYNLGRHISTSLDGYGDIWSLSDREILFAIEKYELELSIDFPHDDYVDDIIKNGMRLTEYLNDDDEE